MRGSYDMCVDCDTLNEIEDHLKRINYNLENSIQSMSSAIQDSKEYLSGYQFEKAKRTTEVCISSSKKTANNIRYAIKYLKDIEGVLDEYAAYAYRGESL